MDEGRSPPRRRGTRVPTQLLSAPLASSRTYTPEAKSQLQLRRPTHVAVSRAENGPHEGICMRHTDANRPFPCAPPACIPADQLPQSSTPSTPWSDARTSRPSSQGGLWPQTSAREIGAVLVPIVRVRSLAGTVCGPQSTLQCPSPHDGERADLSVRAAAWPAAVGGSLDECAADARTALISLGDHSEHHRARLYLPRLVHASISISHLSIGYLSSPPSLLRLLHASAQEHECLPAAPLYTHTFAAPGTVQVSLRLAAVPVVAPSSSLACVPPAFRTKRRRAARKYHVAVALVLSPEGHCVIRGRIGKNASRVLWHRVPPRASCTA
jgi:hypothetical protein